MRPVHPVLHHAVLNLAALPQTGTYKLEFKVTDKISDVSVERDVELDITVE